MEKHKHVPSERTKRQSAVAELDDSDGTLGRPAHAGSSSKRPKSNKGNQNWTKQLDEEIVRNFDSSLGHLLRAFRKKLYNTTEDEITRHGGILFGGRRLCANDVCSLLPGRKVLPAVLNSLTQLPAAETPPGICVLSSNEMFRLSQEAQGFRSDLTGFGLFGQLLTARLVPAECVVGPLYVSNKHWVVLEARLLPLETTFIIYHNQFDDAASFWVDMLEVTEKIIPFISRLLGTDEFEKRPEWIPYSQRVKKSDAGVAAAVVTMDRCSVYPSNVGYLDWPNTDPNSEAQSLWLRRQLAINLFPKSLKERYVKSSVAEVNNQPSFGGLNSPSIVSKQLANLSVDDLDARPTSEELNGIEEMHHKQALVESNNPDIEQEEDFSGLPEQASSTVSAILQPEPTNSGGSTALHGLEMDHKANPKSTRRPLRNKTAPKVSYDTSIHSQDKELRRVGAYSGLHSSPSSNKHGRIQTLVSPPVHIRLLKSLEDRKRLRAACTPDPILAKSSSGPLYGHLPSTPQIYDDSLYICPKESISKKPATPATEVRRLSSQTAPKQQAALAPPSTNLTPCSASLDSIQLNTSEPEIRKPEAPEPEAPELEGPELEGPEPEASASASTICLKKTALFALDDMDKMARPPSREPSLSLLPTDLLTPESEALLFTSLEANDGQFMIKQGQIYWNEHGTPMLVKRIHRHADSITVLAFDQCLAYENPAEVLLWKEEWILQLDEERTLSLNQAKDEWNNEACIMPWPDFATASHSKRVKNLVCRFAKQKSQPTVVRVGRGFQKIESNDLTPWIRCAVCEEMFHINQGWSYCRSCEKTSHDQCLTGETFFIRELHPREQSNTLRTLQLAKRGDPGSFSNAKCVCGADYTYEDIPTDNQWTSAGPVDDLAEKPIRTHFCDAGTEYFRINSTLSCNQNQSTLLYEIPSQFRVDRSGEIGLTVTVGRTLSHWDTEEGMLVSPVKKIILDASMEVKLREKGVKITPTEVLTLAIRELYKSLVPGQLNMAAVEPFAHVTTAFPAGFDMIQRSAFTTGVKLACPSARISVVPEPVAAFYYAASLLLPNPDSESADLQKLDAGSYVLFDIGATTLDIAWLQYGPDNDVKVVRDVGFELGANWAQLRTIDHFYHKVTDAEAIIREQVQAYHSKRNENQADYSMKAYRNMRIAPVYERFWEEYLAKVETSLAKDFENHCTQGSMLVGETHRNLIIAPDEPADVNVIMCGGGAESEELCKRI